MKRTFTLLLTLLIFISIAESKILYISPDGNDTTGNGTMDSPYESLMKAQYYVSPGDTIFMRGGKYVIKESQIYKKESIWAYINYLTKSGSADKPICYFAYPGEDPVFDLSNVKPEGYRNTVFYVKGSYLHFKGFEVTGVQVTIKTHTQSECFRNEGSHNIYEQLKMHDGMAIGFYLTKGSNNLVLNCDAYRNWDSVSEKGRGGNTDGFGFHASRGGTGNKMKGCRAWFNSDDGYDCINCYESVTFDSCWAFYNGYNTSFQSEGDGNGFKAGGYGRAPIVSRLPDPIPSNKILFCLAYRNKASGFYANHHVVAGSYWYNNTAYRNRVNYNMLSQKITTSRYTGNDTTLDCPGINHILHNNLSLKYSSLQETSNMGSSVNTYNSFSPGIGIAVSSADFESTLASELTSARKPDGSLPDIKFLKLVKGSDLIDAGTDLGFPYAGASPDLGAFEYNPVEENNVVLSGKSEMIYYNSVNKILYLPDASLSSFEVINIHGKKLIHGSYSREVDLSGFTDGIYLVKVVMNEGTVLVRKLVKR